MNDCVKKFFEHYIKGDLISAVGQILPSPDVSYDHLESSENLLPWLINFIDASVFSNTYEARFQNAIMCNFMSKEENFGACKAAFDRLKTEDQYLFLQLGGTLEPEEKKMPSFFQDLLALEKESLPLENLSQVPEGFQQLFQFQHKMMQGWQKFKKEKPLFIPNFSKEYENLHPWYPLQYSLAIPLLEIGFKNKIPIIFFEPVKASLSSLIHQLDGQPAIYAFTTISKFFQMLQFPDFAESLCKAEHLVYILELYPHSQFTSQELDFIKSKELYPVFFSSTQPMQMYAPILLQALKECLVQPKNEMKIDTPAGNWVYDLSKRMLLSIQQNRLGPSRLPALHMKLDQMRWYDRHKGLPPKDKSLGPELNDPMQRTLANLVEKRSQFPRIKKNRLLLAHVVPQIVAGGHAPSRLLENLVLNHDAEKFEVIVVSTEVLKLFPLEYPCNFYNSTSSKERGGSRLYKFQQIGVKTFINENSFFYNASAFDLAHLLNHHQVDAAIFHGPDIVNTMAAQMVNAPLRILFEHGSQPAYPGYDLAIVSSFTAVELYEELYKKIKTEPIGLPFAVDVREQWLPEPFKREELGLPQKGFILTTISTKLDMRVTDELCHAIAEILRRVPESYYAPIGEIYDPQRIIKIFAEYDVADRFYPLESRKGSPSQYARSMDLYLNEFPFGGCLAILDAMAAGCPVVTMYDVHGPQQARYGGYFIGLDRAITSGKKEDYIALACQLLTNAEIYQEWSQHTINQYEKFADVKGYVHSLEEIILKNYYK